MRKTIRQAIRKKIIKTARKLAFAQDHWANVRWGKPTKEFEAARDRVLEYAGKISDLVAELGEWS